MKKDMSRNRHPKYGNGRGYHRRSNGRKRKIKDKQKLLYSFENPSRCSKLSGVWERKGQLVWYSYHVQWFRKYSDSVIRGQPLLEIPTGSWYKKIYDYCWQCW